MTNELDPEDERILSMTREELEADLAKRGETFDGAVARVDRIIDQAKRQARVLRAIFGKNEW